MTDLFVPGEDLRTAATNLDKVLNLIDPATVLTKSGDGFGPLGGASDVQAAAEDFDSRWSDGVIQLHREATDIQAALKAVVDAFDNTDQQLIDAMNGKDDSGGG